MKNKAFIFIAGFRQRNWVASEVLNTLTTRRSNAPSYVVFK